MTIRGKKEMEGEKKGKGWECHRNNSHVKKKEGKDV